MASIDTIADRSSGSEIAGKAYFETSTNKFIVYSGSAWVEFDSDGTGAYFANQYSLSFDGSDYLDPGSNAFDSVLSSSFTISLWYKSPSAFPQGDPTWGWSGAFLANQFISQKGVLDLRLNSLNSSSDATIEIYYSPYTGSSGNYNMLGQVTTSTVISPNTWYSIIWTADRSSGQSTLYIDGNSTTLTTVGSFLSSVPAGSFSADSNITIGMRNGSSSGASSGDLFLTGGLDEVAIFNSALTSEQVASLIDSSGANPVPADLSSFINNGLAAWYRMGDDSSDTFVNGGSVSSITDSSGNGNTATQATASAQPTFSTSVPA